MDDLVLFQAALGLVMALVKEMPVRAIAELVGEHDTKLWRVVHHYLDAAVAAQDLSGMRRLGLDDTSFRRGQDYVTVFADLEAGERRAVFVVEGRDQATVEQFKGFLVGHGGAPGNITEVCQDMSAAYLAGVREHLPQAQVTFDRYHVKQKLSEAVDTIRRAESHQHRELLRGTRYLWLKRSENLTVKQLDWLDDLLAQPLATVAAYELALRFDDFYDIQDPDQAEEYLGRWITEANASGLEPIIAFTEMLHKHWDGVIRWHRTRVSNGLLEGLNSLIQAAKRRARGYRTPRNYKTMIYLVAGKLNPGPQLG